MWAHVWFTLVVYKEDLLIWMIVSQSVRTLRTQKIYNDPLPLFWSPPMLLESRLEVRIQTNSCSAQKLFPLLSCWVCAHVWAMHRVPAHLLQVKCSVTGDRTEQSTHTSNTHYTTVGGYGGQTCRVRDGLKSVEVVIRSRGCKRNTELYHVSFSFIFPFLLP